MNLFASWQVQVEGAFVRKLFHYCEEGPLTPAVPGEAEGVWKCPVCGAVWPYRLMYGLISGILPLAFTPGAGEVKR